MDKSTDDFYTYGDQNGEPTPEPTTDCKCMYHHGETAQTECKVSPEITAHNIATLKNG